MPTTTYTPLANLTLGTAASSIVFGSIPTIYRDLVLVFVGTGSTTLGARLRLNGDTGSNYSYVRMSGNGSGASTAKATGSSGFLSEIAQANTTEQLQLKVDLIDYSVTNKHKTIISRADQAGSATEAFFHRYANTSAVTSVTILTSTGNFAAGTTAALYGIVS